MNTLLELANGRQAGLVARLSTGDTCRIGTGWDCEYCIREDDALSECSAAITETAEGPALFSFSSAPPVLLNGEQVLRSPLAHGDWVHVGQSLLRVYRERSAEVERATPVDELLVKLRKAPEPLFALWDGALEPQLTAFGAAEFDALPLMELRAEEALTEARPMIASLPSWSAAGAWLIRATWGRGRLVLCRSNSGLEELRDHFHSFLFSHSSSAPGFVFRSFDPRVLRLAMRYLPTADAPDLFGPITTLLIEDRLPSTLLEFQLVQGNLRCGKHQLTTGVSHIPQQYELRPKGVTDAQIVSGVREYYPGADPTQVTQLAEIAMVRGVKTTEAAIQSILLSLEGGQLVWNDPEISSFLKNATAGVDAALDLYTLAFNQRRRLA